MFGRKEVPVQIVFDNAEFQLIVDRVKDLKNELAEAVTALGTARQELEQARKDLDRSTEKLKAAKRRPVIINNR